MSIPILNELQAELNRLYIAGSPLSNDDPRLKKYLPALQALGQRAPVFAALAKRLELLLASEPKQSAGLLLEAGSLLYAVQYTQGDLAIEGDWQELSGAGIPLTAENIPYSQLSAVMEVLTSGTQTHSKLVEELVAAKRHRDPRLFGAYVQSVSGTSSYVSNYVEKVIIPSIGADMVPYLRDEIDPDSDDKGHARLFRALYNLIGKEILPLSEQVLQGKPGNPIYVEAVATLIEDSAYESRLLELASSKRGAVRQAAFATLIRMNSQQGEDALLEALKGDKIAPLAEALVLDKSPLAAQCIREQFLQNLPNFEQTGNKLKVLMELMVERRRSDEHDLLFDAYYNYANNTPAFLAMGMNDILLKLIGQNDSPSNRLLYRIGSSIKGFETYKITGAVRMLSPTEVFERCASDVLHDKSLANPLTTWLGLNLYSDIVLSDSERKWDRRWAPLLLLLGDAANAYLLIYDDDEKSWGVLLKLAKSTMKSNNYSASLLIKTVARACRNNHPKAKEYYDMLIASGFDKSNLDELIHWKRNQT